MARRSARVRAALPITVSHARDEASFTTQTRDISEAGVFLEHVPVELDLGALLTLTLMDRETGELIELDGVVTRLTSAENPLNSAVGVRLERPPATWTGLVRRLAQGRAQTANPVLRRLRILVVGDDARRRGAMALYVTSGWDVRFASDLQTTREALSGFRVDAVVAEHDLDDRRWAPVLEEVRRQQPMARRVIRANLRGDAPPNRGGPEDLVHQVVDVDAGLEAFVAAITEG